MSTTRVPFRLVPPQSPTEMPPPETPDYAYRAEVDCAILPIPAAIADHKKLVAEMAAEGLPMPEFRLERGRAVVKVVAQVRFAVPMKTTDQWPSAVIPFGELEMPLEDFCRRVRAVFLEKSPGVLKHLVLPGVPALADEA